jgi:SAM-dependent methyltransferase
MEVDPNKFIIKNEVFVRDWDGLYGSIPDPWSQEKESAQDVSLHLALQLLKSYSINSAPPRCILDIGCATGYHSVDLTNLFPEASYVGIDVSSIAIAKAREKFSDVNVNFLHEDILSPSKSLTDSHFDTVVCFRSIYYLAPEIDLAIERIANVLDPRDGGSTSRANAAGGGYFLWTYNHRPDSYTNKLLTPQRLSDKLQDKGLILVAGLQFREGSKDEIVDVRLHRKG